MNLKNKLFGSEDDNRAVSPVIGVILMVAIVVILAAVVASAVISMGDGLGDNQEATSGASMDFDGETMSISLTTEGNADDWELRGDYNVSEGNVAGTSGAENTGEANGDGYLELSGAGDTISLSCEDGVADTVEEAHIENGESGTVTVVASIEGSDSWTTVSSEDFDCSS